MAIIDADVVYCKARSHLRATARNSTPWQCPYRKSTRRRASALLSFFRIDAGAANRSVYDWGGHSSTNTKARHGRSHSEERWFERPLQKRQSSSRFFGESRFAPLPRFRCVCSGSDSMTGRAGLRLIHVRPRRSATGRRTVSRRPTRLPDRRLLAGT